MREAQKPFMAAVQNAFMMYMAGSQISIWSMMMTSMGIYNPLNQIMTVNQYFKRVRHSRVAHLALGSLQSHSWLSVIVTKTTNKTFWRESSRTNVWIANSSVWGWWNGPYHAEVSFHRAQPLEPKCGAVQVQVDGAPANHRRRLDIIHCREDRPRIRRSSPPFIAPQNFRCARALFSALKAP